MLRDRVERTAGPQEAAIFDVQRSILDDAELIAGVEELIRQNLGAEKAFEIVMLEWSQRFARSSHAMLRERVGDLKDVEIRVSDIPARPAGPRSGRPAEGRERDSRHARSHAEPHGAARPRGDRRHRDRRGHAHVARRDSRAVARASGGRRAAHGDATAHRARRPRSSTARPDCWRSIRRTRTSRRIASARARKSWPKRSCAHLSSLEAVTTDGVRITLRANVDLPEEAELGATSGAEGVGLMRTEFLVVGRATMPDEEEQYRAYRRVVEAFGKHPVVIRTFDVGGDKLPVGGYPTEPNPFLGWRAIRMCLDQPELFGVQLRALLRAAVHGDVRIMLPLVVTRRRSARRARAARRGGARARTRAARSFRRDVPLGVMIETPAAAVSCDTFVKDVAFFSIGTNDLVQYTLAVDRGNANLATRFTPLHPAVLKLIRRTIFTAHQHELDVAVCGEMASQPLMAFALIGLGVRELSVAPRSVPLVKRIVRGISVEVAEEAAKAAVGAGTAAESEATLRQPLWLECSAAQRCSATDCPSRSRPQHPPGRLHSVTHVDARRGVGGKSGHEPRQRRSGSIVRSSSLHVRVRHRRPSGQSRRRDLRRRARRDPRRRSHGARRVRDARHDRAGLRGRRDHDDDVRARAGHRARRRSSASATPIRRTASTRRRAR